MCCSSFLPSPAASWMWGQGPGAMPPRWQPVDTALWLSSRPPSFGHMDGVFMQAAGSIGLMTLFQT